jgi:hypothetical protein
MNPVDSYAIARARPYSLVVTLLVGMLGQAASATGQTPTPAPPGSEEHARIERQKAVQRVLSAGVRASDQDIWNARSDSADVSMVPRSMKVPALCVSPWAG